MKKYKLIKKYPGSPELNTIFDYWTDGILEQVYNKSTNPSFIPLKTVKQHPEFWEEVVEKDYEILSFIHNGQHNVKINIIIKIKNGFLDSDSQKLPLEHYLNASCWNIYSVKRLSDGEVFTVGDKIENGKYKSSITSITLDNLCDSDVCIETEGFICAYYNNCCLSCIKHSKKPLFTTEDGVDIFEGDDCYIIHNWIPLKTKVFSDDYGNTKTVYKFVFSTKEAAEEYILMNKPCLSIKDIQSIYVSAKEGWRKNGNQKFYFEELVKLVKSKV